MQFVASTSLALALAAIVLWRGPRTGLLILFALIPMGMMAAVNLPAVGGTTILALDLVLLALVARVVLRPGGTTDLLALLRAGPGAWLALFLIYAVFATLFFPRIFAGETEVFSIGRVEGQVGIVSQPLAPGAGNLSQALRMVLAVLAFAATALALRRGVGPALVYRAVVVATVVHVAMGLIDIATYATGTVWLLGWARTANYALTLGQELVGLNRLIGGFPEASSYGYVSVALLGFWLCFWVTDRGRAGLPPAMVAATAFVVLRGTSSSAYVGAGLVVAVLVVERLVRAAGDRGRPIPRRAAAIGFVALALVPAAAMGAYVLYELVPGFAAFLDRVLLDKLTSPSGVERMGWNAQALRNFLDTNMLGAGLGSLRGSNWLAAVLGTTGLPGLVLMGLFLVRVFTASGAPDAEAARLALALKFALVGFFGCALVVLPTPNLDAGFFAMSGLVVGLCRAPAVRPRPVPPEVALRSAT